MEYKILSENSLDFLLTEEFDWSEELDEETLDMLRELELRGWD